MADDSELDHIRTFLGLAHTTATSKSFSEVKNINLINDTERILTHPGEILSSNENFYTKRYLVKLSEISEKELMNMIHDILETITKLNKRQAITGWTYTSHALLCNMHLANSNKVFTNPQTKRADQDIYLDIEWSTT